MKNFSLRPLVAFLLAAGYSGFAAASGFALIEQSASSAGNAHAGNAALAEDATTNYFNPAGLVHVKGSNFVNAVHVLVVDGHFTKTSATSGAGTPTTGGDGGNLGGVAALPNIYYSRELSPTMTFAVGVNAPFGLKTQYQNDWVGRYQATLSAIKAVNINPGMGWKVNDSVSVGAGISVQNFAAELVHAVDFGAVCFGALGAAAPSICGPVGLVPQGKDGQVKLKGDDWGYGFNLGALFQLSKETRLGIAYRSSIHHKIQGDVTYLIPAGLPGPIASAPNFTNGKATVTVKTPEFLEVSLVSQIDPKLTVMGDVTMTRWSRLKELRVNFANGAAPAVTPYEWGNTIRVSGGLSYQLDSAWKLRAGVAFETAGVQDHLRTPVLPDSDRKYIAFGANYRFSDKNSIDMAYIHAFLKNSTINHSEPPFGGTIVGSYRSKADIFSVQFNHKF
jgi:long-chain fatty acid transport protein